MPYALQYGMTPYEFWHGDLSLFEARRIAYYRDKEYTAWLNAVYNAVSTEFGVVNALATKNSQRVQFVKYYPYKDPFPPKKTEPKDIERTFRQGMVKQHSWLHNMLQGAKNA